MFLLREKPVPVALVRAATTYESSGSSGWTLGPGVERMRRSLEGDAHPVPCGEAHACAGSVKGRGGALRLSQSERSLGRR